MRKILFIGSFPTNASNLGDQAQTWSILNYLHNNFSDYQLHQFYRTELNTDRYKDITSTVNEDDIIIISSSGDFGSRYKGWHNTARPSIIQQFSNNQIIQLPTTVYYDNSAYAESLLKQDKTIYNNNNITILCREPVSESIASTHFSCNVKFFPDFAFYIQPETYVTETKNNILLNLRNDGERAISKEYTNTLSKLTNTTPINIHTLPYNVVPDVRDKTFSNLFKTYQSYNLIITDQMHSMIFAIINNIPCIAIDDAIPHKLSGYKSVTKNAVKYLDLNINQSIPELITQTVTEYEQISFKHYFDTFRSMIK